jgi:hypothetical protein
MSKVVSARIRFLGPEEGGRLDPARDGIRPQLKLGDVFTSTVVRSTTGASTFDAGRDYDVHLEIVYWEQYADLFDPSSSIGLYEGSRLIAVGEFLD